MVGVLEIIVQALENAILTLSRACASASLERQE